MADYPDWVLAHKKKGTYINRVGDKYYLYAAHSERIRGTDKVRRVSDGYLGRITETEGFIPAKRKLNAEVFVYEHGLSEIIFRLSAQIHKDLKRKFKTNADLVMAAGMLLFMYGHVAPELYETSGVCIKLPGLDMDASLTGRQRAGVDTTARRVAYEMKGYFGDDFTEAVELLPLVRLVIMGGDERLAAVPSTVAAFIKKQGLDFKEVK